MQEHGIKGSNAFSSAFLPDRRDTSLQQPIADDILKIIQVCFLAMQNLHFRRVIFKLARIMILRKSINPSLFKSRFNE